MKGQTVLTESSARLADLLNDGWDNSVGKDWREDDEVGQLIHDTLSTGQLVQSVSTFIKEEDLMNLFEILKILLILNLYPGIGTQRSASRSHGLGIASPRRGYPQG